MSRKRILFLCHRIPYPPNKGDKIRSFHELTFLSRYFDVDLITLADTPGDTVFKNDLEQVCSRVAVFPLKKKRALVRGALSLITGKTISQAWFYENNFQAQFNAWIRQNSYHAIVCFSSPMAEYVFKSGPEIGLPIRVMDFCDLDSDKWHQYSRKKTFPMNLLYRTEGIRLLEYEKQVNRVFDWSVFVSQAEMELFQRAFPQARHVAVLGNGVDSEYFSAQEPSAQQTGMIMGQAGNGSQAPVVMFSGAMDYFANVDGVAWFATTVLPLIRQQFPGTRFDIVGSNPHPEVRALEHDPGIRVTGFVPDIREYYRAADVCVIPLRIARGVQNKVLEAMAMEKPVVTTSHAVQGIRPSPGKDCLVADEPADFARAVIHLLENTLTMKAMGASARQYILTHHSWENNLSDLLSMLDNPSSSGKSDRS